MPILPVVHHQHRPPHALLRRRRHRRVRAHGRAALRQGAHSSSPILPPRPASPFLRFPSPVTIVTQATAPLHPHNPRPPRYPLPYEPRIPCPQDASSAWTLLAAGIRLYIDSRCNNTIPLLASRLFVGSGALRFDTSAHSVVRLHRSRATRSHHAPGFHLPRSCDLAKGLAAWRAGQACPLRRVRGCPCSRPYPRADGLEVFGASVLAEEGVTAIWRVSLFSFSLMHTHTHLSPFFVRPFWRICASLSAAIIRG